MSVKNCDHCHKEYKAKSLAKSRFCSRACSVLANKAEPRKCKTCDVEFSPVRHMKHKNRMISDRAGERCFCSKDCLRISKLKGHEKECLHCSVLFTPVRVMKSFDNKYYPYDLPTTCSNQCSSSHYFTDKRRSDISARMKGRRHPLWQGGSHRSGFRGYRWNKIAEEARTAAGRICKHCGKSEEENGRKLDVHHKTPFHQSSNKAHANRKDNLEALCRSCHQKADHAWRKMNPIQIVIGF